MPAVRLTDQLVSLFLHSFPMLEIFGIEFDVVAYDVLQQARHTHSVLTDFTGELVKHLMGD